MDINSLREIMHRLPSGIRLDGMDDDSMVAFLQFADALVRECADIAFDQWVDNGHEESARPTILRRFGLS